MLLLRFRASLPPLLRISISSSLFLPSFLPSFFSDRSLSHCLVFTAATAAASFSSVRPSLSFSPSLRLLFSRENFHPFRIRTERNWQKNTLGRDQGWGREQHSGTAQQSGEKQTKRCRQWPTNKQLLRRLRSE